LGNQKLKAAVPAEAVVAAASLPGKHQKTMHMDTMVMVIMAHAVRRRRHHPALMKLDEASLSGQQHWFLVPSR